MLDLGFQELIVIFGVAIIVFGPKKLPELSRNLGRGIGQLKKALFDVKYEINREMNLLDEESGKVSEGGEPKWKKEALDAIYGNKGPVSGGVQSPGPEHYENPSEEKPSEEKPADEKPADEKPADETKEEGSRDEGPSGGGAAG